MPKFIEMDERVTISKQMEEEDTGPIVFVNKFSVNSEDIDEFLKRWAADAGLFKKQPGYISAQLHRGIARSGVFINYAIWESASHLRNAEILVFGKSWWSNDAGIQARIPEYPPSITISPHIFKKVAVPGICVE
jgi:Antibiotic biosynthesis monooxygenase